MEAATLSRTPPRSGPIQVGVIASLLVVAAGAWAETGDRMGGMDAGPGTELGGLGWFAVVWVTMMAAMMLPSIAPGGDACSSTKSGGAGSGARKPVWVGRPSVRGRSRPIGQSLTDRTAPDAVAEVRE